MLSTVGGVLILHSAHQNVWGTDVKWLELNLMSGTVIEGFSAFSFLGFGGCFWWVIVN